MNNAHHSNLMLISELGPDRQQFDFDGSYQVEGDRGQGKIKGSRKGKEATKRKDTDVP